MFSFWSRNVPSFSSLFSRGWQWRNTKPHQVFHRTSPGYQHRSSWHFCPLMHQLSLFQLQMWGCTQSHCVGKYEIVPVPVQATGTLHLTGFLLDIKPLTIIPSRWPCNQYFTYPTVSRWVATRFWATVWETPCTYPPTGPYSVHENMAGGHSTQWGLQQRSCCILLLWTSVPGWPHIWLWNLSFYSCKYHRCVCALHLELHWDSWNRCHLPHKTRHPEADLMTTSNANLETQIN